MGCGVGQSKKAAWQALSDGTEMRPVNVHLESTLMGTLVYVFCVGLASIRRMET
tara:strand:- start:8122 stop:8283 length:162 start_codon:yes stop_codon:yes gene_type:complete